MQGKASKRGTAALCATYDIKRIAFAKTAEEWPSRPCSRTFMAFRDWLLYSLTQFRSRSFKTKIKTAFKENETGFT